MYLYLTLSFEQGEHNLEKLENKFLPSNVLAEAELTKKLMGLTLAKGEDPQKLGKRIAIIQSGFKIQVEEKEHISAVVNAGGVRYAAAIGQDQRFCKMKLEPVTAGGPDRQFLKNRIVVRNTGLANPTKLAHERVTGLNPARGRL